VEIIQFIQHSHPRTITSADSKYVGYDAHLNLASKKL